MRPGLVLAAVALASACRVEVDNSPYIDVDDDGFALAVDCDDEDPGVWPGADERCDGVDNDCDGLVDEDPIDPEQWYRDVDLDGYGDPWDLVEACESPEGYVAETGDCDDRDPAFHPGAVEDDCTDPADYNCDGSVAYEDADADGWPACEDCDDTDVKVNPAAVEFCDGVDNDCDGMEDGPDAVDAPTWFVDADLDGFGTSTFTLRDCEAPFGYVEDDTDCDDQAATTYPGADEVCDEVDQDCDEVVDEDAVDAPTWYGDSDGDGHGGGVFTQQACEQPEGFASAADDCDDLDPASYPGGVEVCDEADNDCDGRVDVAAVDEVEFYGDRDGDGYGVEGVVVAACELPSGYAEVAGDCDDRDAAIHPGAVEVCDRVDNDCDELVDEAGALGGDLFYADVDGDGHGDPDDSERSCTAPAGRVDSDDDCDDEDDTSYPGAEEWCDEVDHDCDGDLQAGAVDASTWYADMDDDGYGSPRFTLVGCEATSGYVDDDQDCDDLDDAIHPGVEEVCDGVDNDCDGTVDLEVLGAEPACPGASCAEIHHFRPKAPSGVYWLEDGAGSFEVECEMTGWGGGWTLVTGELLEDRDWVDFALVAGSGVLLHAWMGDGSFYIEPYSGVSSCDTVGVRATATLPFTFTEWFGTWVASGLDSLSQQDDVSTTAGWGGTTHDCGGHVLFGTDLDTSKKGGLWGWQWNYRGGMQRWTWSRVEVHETDVIRWEVLDQGPNEDVVFERIDVWVR